MKPWLRVETYLAIGDVLSNLDVLEVSKLKITSPIAAALFCVSLTYDVVKSFGVLSNSTPYLYQINSITLAESI
uniref:Uncharacterized protein n=1 Tax=Glossina morsitans morsitans TaxID=37546 RepID=A0A1B0FMB8_GLOMM